MTNQEFGNENSLRAYPFVDDATLTDTDGVALPTDFLVDAQLYPFEPVQLYLGAIDTLAGTITVNRADTNTPYATGSLTVNPIPLYELTGYGRQVGVLVGGDGLTATNTGSTHRTFTATATLFSVDVMTPILQEGVRGFLLPDGTLMTGDISWFGNGGITITSNWVNGTPVLTFNMEGQPDPLPEECDGDGPPICGIHVVRYADSPIQVSQIDQNTLALSTFNYDLDDVCAAKKARYLPDADGNLPTLPADTDTPCHPTPVTPVTPPTDSDITLDFDVCGTGQALFTIVPWLSSLPYVRNPIQVKSNMAPMSPARLVLPRPANDEAAVDRAVKAHSLQQFGNNGIIIGFKGT